MRCKLCQSSDVGPLPFAVPSDRGTWHRCKACGSDTNEAEYNPELYADNDAYRSGYDHQSIESLRDDCRVNCEWFDDAALRSKGSDLLDIGCGPGAALDVMAERGWTVHGFEVSAVYLRHPVVVRSVFHRWWWPKQFAAVLAREVFEHVPGPEMFLHECHGVTVPGGLFQVQTPRPTNEDFPHTYGRGHLFIASPDRLKVLLDESMFDLIGERHWDRGQAYLCRAR